MRPYRNAWLALLAMTAFIVALFGAVPTRYGFLWALDTVGMVLCSIVAAVSIFRSQLFYVRTALMTAPFLARGALYFATPEALPNRNEFAAGTINIFVGVSIVLLDAIFSEDE